MGLDYCLSTLKESAKLLQQIDFHLAKREKMNRKALHAQAAQDQKHIQYHHHYNHSHMPESVINSQRIVINQHIADMTVAVTEVHKYFLILNGIPIKQLFDNNPDTNSNCDSDSDSSSSSDSSLDPETYYDPDLRSNIDPAICTFMAKTVWSTGLLPLMQGAKRKKPVTNGEIYAVYCAIGCTSFTTFEVGVHRMVDHVADQIWDTAVTMGIVNPPGTTVMMTRTRARRLDTGKA